MSFWANRPTNQIFFYIRTSLEVETCQVLVPIMAPDAPPKPSIVSSFVFFRVLPAHVRCMQLSGISFQLAGRQAGRQLGVEWGRPFIVVERESSPRREEWTKRYLKKVRVLGSIQILLQIQLQQMWLIATYATLKVWPWLSHPPGRSCIRDRPDGVICTVPPDPPLCQRLARLWL